MQKQNKKKGGYGLYHYYAAPKIIMLLCILFEHETIPFILSEASEEECLTAIEKAKESFEFVRNTAIVESDRIILHAWRKQKNHPKKRLYCLNDKIILETDTLYKEEKESTRELLAYEHNVPVEKICVVEI